MEIKLIYIGILGLIVTFVTLPAVVQINDTLMYCEGEGQVLLTEQCSKIDEMYTSMNVYFIVAIVIGVFGMLFVVAGLVATDKDDRRMLDMR